MEEFPVLKKTISNRVFYRLFDMEKYRENYKKRNITPKESVQTTMTKSSVRFADEQTSTSSETKSKETKVNVKKIKAQKGDNIPLPINVDKIQIQVGIALW